MCLYPGLKWPQPFFGTTSASLPNAGKGTWSRLCDRQLADFARAGVGGYRSWSNQNFLKNRSSIAQIEFPMAFFKLVSPMDTGDDAGWILRWSSCWRCMREGAGTSPLSRPPVSFWSSSNLSSTLPGTEQSEHPQWSINLGGLFGTCGIFLGFRLAKLHITCQHLWLSTRRSPFFWVRPDVVLKALPECITNPIQNPKIGDVAPRQSPGRFSLERGFSTAILMQRSGFIAGQICFLLFDPIWS